MAQAPMAITHLGSGICSYSVLMRGAIFSVTVPATIITSDWRGDGRNTPAPKRSRSKREAPAAIISIAQQARPKVIGQGEDLRAQLKSHSTVVVITFGSACLLSNNPISSLLHSFLTASRLQSSVHSQTRSEEH